jgi:hypothetical protein
MEKLPPRKDGSSVLVSLFGGVPFYRCANPMLEDLITLLVGSRCYSAGCKCQDACGATEHP